MAFAHDIRALAEQASEKKDGIDTEEATKNALIMPFLRVLGYDVFDPKEVVPEFTADGGHKKAWKVDYALCPFDTDPLKPAIIIECKACGRELKAGHTDQLHRYFPQTPARFGILTNGLTYLFYADVEKTNVMGNDPFLEVDLLQLSDTAIRELEMFAKAQFNPARAVQRAEHLHYTRAVKKKFAEYYSEPNEDFARYFIGQIDEKKNTQSVRAQFTPLVHQAFHQFVNEQINARIIDRLAQTTRGMLSQDAPYDVPAKDAIVHEDSDTDTKIITTEEELNAFYIIKAILRGRVAPERVAMRDVQTYCGILLDDNRNKRICLLRFNNPKKKQLSLFDASKKEQKVPIQSLDDIYQFADQLVAAVDRYESEP